MVPTSIDELSIAVVTCANGTSRDYVGSADVKRHGFREMIGNAAILDNVSMDFRVEVRGLKLRSTGSSTASQHSQAPRDLCSTLQW